MKNNEAPLCLVCHSERSEKSSRIVAAGNRVASRGGFFATLRMTVTLATCTGALSAAETTPAISAASLLARTKTLSSDEFEGRAPASAGEEKTVSYLVSEFKKLGLQPGNPNGTYTQDAALVGITSKPTLAFNIGSQPMPMVHINDYVAFCSRITPRGAFPSTNSSRPSRSTRSTRHSLRRRAASASRSC